MPISRRLLAEDEEVLVDIRPHWVFFAGPATALIAVVVIALVVMAQFPHRPMAVTDLLGVIVAVPAVWFLLRVARWFGISLVVTTTRLLYRHGVLSSDMIQLRLQRLADVHSNQSLLDRIIGSGKLVFEVEGDDAITVDDVRRPRAVQRVIAEQLDHLWGTGGGSPIRPPSTLTPPHGVPVSRRGAGPGPVPVTEPGPGSGPGQDDKGVGGNGSEKAEDAGSDGTRIAEQLVNLDNLRKRGVITPEEFAEKKAELLDRM